MVISFSPGHEFTISNRQFIVPNYDYNDEGTLIQVTASSIREVLISHTTENTYQVYQCFQSQRPKRQEIGYLVAIGPSICKNVISQSILEASNTVSAIITTTSTPGASLRGEGIGKPKLRIGHEHHAARTIPRARFQLAS